MFSHVAIHLTCCVFCIFSEASEDFDFESDGDGRSATDEESQQMPPPPLQASVRIKQEPGELPEFVDPLKGGARAGSLCYYCLDKKVAGRNKFCADHKSHAEAVLNDAVAQDKMAEYREECKTPERYRAMLKKFIDECGSRGRGSARPRFDWISFLERVLSERKIQRGGKEVMKCKAKFIEELVERQAWEKEEALELWVELEEDTRTERDHGGPRQSPLRLPCPVEDYIDRSNSSAFIRERQAGTTTKKPKQAQFAEHDSATHAQLPSWADQHFQVGSASGHTRNKHVTNGHKQAETVQLDDTPKKRGRGYQYDDLPCEAKNIFGTHWSGALRSVCVCVCACVRACVCVCVCVQRCV
jgi:hypothetical protein